MRSVVLSALPYPVQVVVGLLAYRSRAQALYGQGTGRLSVDEIDSYRLEVWENINALLTASKQKQPEHIPDGAMYWILGGRGPSEADAAVFGFIASTLVCNAYVSLYMSVRRIFVLIFLLERQKPRRY